MFPSTKTVNGGLLLDELEAILLANLSINWDGRARPMRKKLIYWSLARFGSRTRILASVDRGDCSNVKVHKNFGSITREIKKFNLKIFSFFVVDFSAFWRPRENWKDAEDSNILRLQNMKNRETKISQCCWIFRLLTSHECNRLNLRNPRLMDHIVRLAVAS